MFIITARVGEAQSAELRERRRGELQLRFDLRIRERFERFHELPRGWIDRRDGHWFCERRISLSNGDESAVNYFDADNSA